MLDAITPLILTLDEEANLERVLAPLSWAHEIVVVDSGSTDGTRTVCERHANVRFIVHPFTTHAEQWNFGLGEAGIRTDWVLALDADYVLSDELVAELRALSPSSDVVGYRAEFRYRVLGRTLRGALYPPVVVLYRRAGARYVQDGHTQRVEVNGSVEALRSPIFHDDRKPLARWLAAQIRYARIEADHLDGRPWAELGWPDRLRKCLFVAPPLAPVYCLIVRGGIFDGWPGLHYALQRAVAEAILSLMLIERKLMRSDHPRASR